MATTPEAVRGSGLEQAQKIRRLFSEIAPRYDLLNHLLSLNADRRWRRRAVAVLGWEQRPDRVYLDACAGTCDLSVELAGRRGFRGRGHRQLTSPSRCWSRGCPRSPAARWHRYVATPLRLPFVGEAFAGATVGFGVRNLADLDGGLAELWRVLEPGARLVVLEFTTPPNPLLRRLYLLYFHRIIPQVGRWVSGHPWAYSYLPASVQVFPEAAELAQRMRMVGFRAASWSHLSGGIAALHVATK